MNSVKNDAFDAFHFDERWAYDKPRLADPKAYEEATQDIFSSLFRRKWSYTESPDPVMRDYLETFKSTEEYKHLRASTCGKVGPAYEAARNLVPMFAAKKAEEEQQRPDKSDAEKRTEARAQLREAQRKADEYEDIENMLGFGANAGTDGEEFPSDAKIDLIKSFRDNPALMRLVRLAGRLINLAENTLHNETTRGVDKLVGVEYSDNLNRIMPGEMWMAAVPDYMLFKVVNKELMTLKYDGEKTKGFGPMVLLVDKSSSMNERGSDKWDYARALMFSIAHLAFAQRREIHIVMFNNSPETPFSPKGPAQLAQWMIKQRCGGGTNFDSVFFRASQIIHEKPTADIIMLTDGEGSVSGKVKETLKKAKEEASLKIFSLVCGCRVPSDLLELSNESMTVHQLLERDGLSSDAEKATRQIMQGVIR